MGESALEFVTKTPFSMSQEDKRLELTIFSRSRDVFNRLLKNKFPEMDLFNNLDLLHY